MIDGAFHIMLALLSAGAIYGGIRADLKAMHMRLAEIRTEVDRCNDRLDVHIDRRQPA